MESSSNQQSPTKLADQQMSTNQNGHDEYQKTTTTMMETDQVETPTPGQTEENPLFRIHNCIDPAHLQLPEWLADVKPQENLSLLTIREAYISIYESRLEESTWKEVMEICKQYMAYMFHQIQQIADNTKFSDEQSDEEEKEDNRSIHDKMKDLGFAQQLLCRYAKLFYMVWLNSAKKLNSTNNNEGDLIESVCKFAYQLDLSQSYKDACYKTYKLNLCSLASLFESPHREDIQSLSTQELADRIEMQMASSVIPEGSFDVYHLVSTAWYEQFINFLRDPDSNDDPGKPNSSQLDINRIFKQKNQIQICDCPQNIINLKPGVKEEKDYKLMDHASWNIVRSKYGQKGLNDVPRFAIGVEKGDEADDNVQVEYIVESQYRRFEVITYPNVRYTQGIKTQIDINVSRNATMQEVHFQICQHLSDDCKPSTIQNSHLYQVHELMRLTRLWKFEGADTLDDAKEMIQKNDIQKAPHKIQGRIFPSHQKVEDARIADGELLVLEFAIQFDHKNETPFYFNPTEEVRQKISIESNLPEKMKGKSLNDRMLVPLNDFFGEQQGLNCGLTGLSNLGNTCFMNSVLQCLANTEPLVKFFLYEIYVNHINQKNTYGTRGRLAVAFAGLVGDLWLGRKRSIAPWDLKTQVARKAIQFQGFAQHDSQEMLSVLLETMHEDCNSICKKPYVEQKDSNGRPDSEVANEFWDGFKLRENSIFIDHFYGQLKSSVQCSRCRNVSITFDPFNVLSVPIAQQKQKSRAPITILYYPASFIQPVIRFTLELNESNCEMTIGDLAEKIQNHLSEKYGQKDAQEPIITLVKDGRIETVLRSNYYLNSIMSGQQIIAMEMLSTLNQTTTSTSQPNEPRKKKTSNVEFMVSQKRSSWGIFSKTANLTQSRVLQLGNNQTERQVKLKIFQLLRPLIQAPDLSTKVKGTESDDYILELEYQHFFGKPGQESTTDEEPIYTLQILNNCKTETGLMYNTKKECEFCKKTHEGNCDFSFKNPNLTMEDILNYMDRERSLVLVANFRSSNPRANISMIERPKIIDLSLSPVQETPEFQKKSNGRNDLYDCLSYFSVEETLQGNDMWYCSKCKDHVVARKKMELYKTPDYLIIHLKRFSHRGGMFGSKKINDPIDFPVDGLNLKKYVQNSEGKNVVYDLYGVSNHFGSMGGGHYTAYCKNPLYQKWYEFDDSSVSKASNPVTAAAYVLFYKRR